MSHYTVYITPRAWKEINDLPGNIRQRVKRAVEALVKNPRPPKSIQLNTPGFEHDLHRLRPDKWRIVYAVSEADKAVDVLAVRERPPYDCGDLGQLLEQSNPS